MLQRSMAIPVTGLAILFGAAQVARADQPAEPVPGDQPADTAPADTAPADTEPAEEPAAKPADPTAAEPTDTAPAPNPEPGVAAETEATVETEVEVEPGDVGGAPPLVLGARFGGIFPPVFSELGTHVTVGLEAGYRLPVMNQRIEVMFGAGWAPPGRSYTVAPYEAEVRQQELTFSLGPRVRLLAPGSKLQVTAAVGFRLFLLRTTSNGSRDMEPFAEFTEDSTRAGFFAAGGGEYRLGPGAAFLDLELGYSSLPHKITGDISTGNLAAVVGYRLFLL